MTTTWTSPDECYDGLVGEQSKIDFLQWGGADSIEELVSDYVSNGPTCQGLSALERDEARVLLSRSLLDGLMAVEVEHVGRSEACPDRPGSVDADLLILGRSFDVTLVPSRDRGARLVTWGSREHWASRDLMDVLDRLDEHDAAALVCGIEDAVTRAAERLGLTEEP